MSTLGLFWTQNEFFVDLVFTINLSFGSRGYCWPHSVPEVIVDLFLPSIFSMSHFFVQKNLSDFILKKTSFSHVWTWKSLIWIQMITLGLFWTQNEILIWIWSITLSLFFGKPKGPIFVPKCDTRLILAAKGPHRFHIN